MSPCPPLPAADLDEVLTATRPLWDAIRGQRLFLTGGTGFFGCWLVETFLHANRALSLNAGLTVLSRNPAAFLAKLPHLAAESALTLIAGDVRDFAFPAGDYPFVLHAATEASARQLAEAPEEMLSTILAGTARVLAFARHAGTHSLLLTSSGAVYGSAPAGMTHIAEDYPGAPDPLSKASVYGEGKRASELMCALAAHPHLSIKIARCWAFTGPHLPLDAHFAAGNFLADALAGRAIRIASDGRSVRSYLYASDLAIWLWTMLFRAPSLRAFNVGSSEPTAIRALAQAAAATVSPAVPVEIANGPGAASIYVPSTDRAQTELGLHQTVTLAEGLRRTIAWHRLKSELKSVEGPC